MDRERLAQLLSTPSEAVGGDVGGLHALTERSPWFSAAHLLRAMAEHASGDVLLDDTVRTAAAHLPSRALLFDRLHPVVATATAPSRPIFSPTPLAVLETPAPHVEPPLPEPMPPAEVPAAEVEPLPIPPALLAPVVEDDLNGPEIEEPTLPAAGAASEEPTFDIAERLLEQQIVESALASGYALTWEHPAPAAIPDRPAEQPAPAHINEPEPVAAPAPAVRSKRRFTDWLSEPAPASTPVPATPPATAAVQTPRAAATGAEAPPSPADTRTLIDRFIHQQTPEPRPKAEFFSPQQAGKRSLEEHAELVTETLARIYEQQGNLSKAIAAYEKLALKVPSKSAYFAARIQELRSRSAK